MRVGALTAIVSTLLLAGCGTRVVHIDSDTTWSGTIDGFGSVSGRGNKTYTLDAASSPVCWTIAKTTGPGTLRVYSEQDTFFGLGSEVEAESTTTEANGTVTGCAR